MRFWGSCTWRHHALPEVRSSTSWSRLRRHASVGALPWAWDEFGLDLQVAEQIRWHGCVDGDADERVERWEPLVQKDLRGRESEGRDHFGGDVKSGEVISPTWDDTSGSSSASNQRQQRMCDFHETLLCKFHGIINNRTFEYVLWIGS